MLAENVDEIPMASNTLKSNLALGRLESRGGDASSLRRSTIL
jgi:hypothetical protein